MPLRLLAVTFQVHDVVGVASFWATLLRREIVESTGGALLPGSDTQVGLQFVSGLSEKVGPNRIHLHLTSASADDQQQVVAKALGLGARHLDIGQRPEEGHIVLGDPEQNEFCVIEPGNAYLAGCGFLGEIACTGTREVGLFWSAALGWPIVWDQDQETAIQSAHAGTKVAWGGTSVTALAQNHRQRFDLVVAGAGAEAKAEVERLLRLGATRLEAGEEGGTLLADPDGIAFCLHAAV